MDAGGFRTPRSIIIADSSSAYLDVVCKAFEVYGHKVFTARTGREALRRTEYFTPDAMIVELGLKEIDGYQVAQEIRAQTRFDATVLIASASLHTQTRVSRAGEHGFDYYVPKPFETMLLNEALYASRQEKMILLSTQVLQQTRHIMDSLRALLQENRALRERSRRLLELMYLLQKKYG